MKERQGFLDRQHPQLSLRRQSALLAVSRTAGYYKAVPESEENLEIMRVMDRHYAAHPNCGILSMQDHLRLEHRLGVNYKRVRRLLRLMGLEAIYPKPSLSKLGKAEYIRPYLLRDLSITRVNQVWQVDISYIPMKKGFMYLMAIIEVYSRFIVGWELSNSLETGPVLSLLKQACEEHGKPQIVNSDQGSQFTSKAWIGFMEEEKITISMDGKGRATDNIFIERFWRTVKYEYVFLNPPQDGQVLFQGLKTYIHYYNYKRSHQGIGRIFPNDRFRTLKKAA
jgi:putative transposase